MAVTATINQRDAGMAFLAEDSAGGGNGFSGCDFNGGITITNSALGVKFVDSRNAP